MPRPPAARWKWIPGKPSKSPWSTDWTCARRWAVYDAQRHAVVAADALRMGLTVKGGGAIGESRARRPIKPDARLRFDEGVYSAGLNLDLPLNARRTQCLAQQLDRPGAGRARHPEPGRPDQAGGVPLREMLRVRESYRIQKQSLSVAERRWTAWNCFSKPAAPRYATSWKPRKRWCPPGTRLRQPWCSTPRRGNQAAAAMAGVLAVDTDGRWQEYIPADHQPVTDSGEKNDE